MAKRTTARKATVQTATKASAPPKSAELMVVPGRWDIPYNYSAGEVASRFLVTLREEGKVIATKCPECKRIILPPRSFCERCFVSLKNSWVDLPPTGQLAGFTIVEDQFANAPTPPYIIAYILLDGATTTFPHFLSGVDFKNVDKLKKDVKMGMKVKLVFKPRAQREGRMRDFSVVPA